MTHAEVVAYGSLIVALLSLAVAIVGVVINGLGNRSTRKKAEEANTFAQQANNFSQQANALSERANMLAAGDAETGMMSAVNAAWDGVHKIHSELVAVAQGRTKLTADEKRQIASIGNGHKFAIERLCDTYETACGRYIDNKCDKERFKKIFHDSIRQLVQNDTEAFRHVLNPGPASKYRAILNVYEEWFHLE